MFSQVVLAILLLGQVIAVVSWCDADNPYQDLKFYFNVWCNIVSGDYDGSEIYNIARGDITRITLARTSIQNEEENVGPIVETIATTAVGEIPVIGGIISGLVSIFFEVLGINEPPPEEDPYPEILEDLTAQMNIELNNLYDYIDEKINTIAKNLLEAEIDSVLDDQRSCSLYKDETNKIACLREIANDCSDGANLFTSFYDSVVDYEEQFPLMRQFGSLCSTIISDLMAAYYCQDEQEHLMVMADKLRNILGDFIDLYDEKLPLIIDYHTTYDRLHEDLTCEVWSLKQHWYTGWGHSWAPFGYIATCSEDFGHRKNTKKRAKELCTVSRFNGCNIHYNDYHDTYDDLQSNWLFVPCNGGTDPECNKAYSLYYALAKIEDKFDEYRRNWKIKIHAYWQNTVGVVIDMWRERLAQLELISSTAAQKLRLQSQVAI